MLSESTSMFGVPLGDERFNAALAQRLPNRDFRIIGAMRAGHIGALRAVRVVCRYWATSGGHAPWIAVEFSRNKL
jgi:hypothetical protein